MYSIKTVGVLSNDFKELPELCDLTVRALDEVIDYQISQA